MAVAIFRTNWSSFKEELWKNPNLNGKEHMYHVWNFSSDIMVYSLYSRTKQTYNDAYLLYKTFTRYAALKIRCKVI